MNKKLLLITIKTELKLILSTILFQTFIRLHCENRTLTLPFQKRYRKG